MKQFFLGLSIVILTMAGPFYGKAFSGGLTRQRALEIYQATRAKFPNARISVEQIQRGVSAESLGKGLRKYVDINKVPASRECDLARSLLRQRADSVGCQEFKDFLDEVAASAPCSTVQDILDQIGMAVIGSCTLYFDDNGDPWGACGCGTAWCVLY